MKVPFFWKNAVKMTLDKQIGISTISKNIVHRREPELFKLHNLVN